MPKIANGFSFSPIVFLAGGELAVLLVFLLEDDASLFGGVIDVIISALAQRSFWRHNFAMSIVNWKELRVQRYVKESMIYPLPGRYWYHRCGMYQPYLTYRMYCRYTYVVGDDVRFFKLRVLSSVCASASNAQPQIQICAKPSSLRSNGKNEVLNTKRSPININPVSVKHAMHGPTNWNIADD